MAEVYVTAQELIKTLDISSQDLISVEEFFDSIPDDEWELTPGKDYRLVNRNGLREYTASGAYTIARYLETIQSQSFWAQVVEWFTHRKRAIRRSFVKKKILDNCSSLVKRNGKFFISRKDAVAIFGTRSDYFTKMADCVQKAQRPLIKGEDYDDFIDEGLYFSLSGLTKLSLAFAENLTKKNRKEECKDVGEVVKEQVDAIVANILQRDKAIRGAMDNARRRDRKTCQVSGVKPNRIDAINLAVHHLYSRNDYPHLADIEKNLITLTSEVHHQFHQNYMGGTVKACTIDDFIEFVHKYYPDNSQVIISLKQRKVALGQQKPIDRRKPPHALYLPASRVS
jgi:hypothetical protein